MVRMDKVQKRHSVFFVTWQGWSLLRSPSWVFFSVTEWAAGGDCCLNVVPACWCGGTQTFPVRWRRQGGKTSAAACPSFVWRVCSGFSPPASCATQTRWPSSSPPWVGLWKLDHIKTEEVPKNSMYIFIFFADVAEDEAEQEDATEMNYFYIRQFQVQTGMFFFSFNVKHSWLIFFGLKHHLWLANRGRCSLS